MGLLEEGLLDIRDTVSRCYGDLFRFAYRMLGEHQGAEDVVQETFLRLVRNGQGGRPHSQQRRWLFVVARNLCVSRLRYEARRAGAARSENEIAGHPTPEETAANDEIGQQVAEAVLSLPVDMREVIILREYENMDYAQIAEIVGCPVGTVRSRLARAREKLRQRLQRFVEDL